MRTVHSFAATIAAAALLLFVSACGGKDSGGATEPTPPKTDDTNTATPVDNPTDNGGTATPAAADPALIAKGAEIYEESCSTCHGDGGAGRGKSPAIKGDGALGNFPTDDALIEYTKKEMPKDDPGSLSDDDVKAVVAWMRS